METRKMLIALAIKNKGNWEQTYLDIQNKKYPSEEEIAQTEKVECITILDDDYPEQLKRGFKPPFVLFYKGNKELLNDTDMLAVVGSRNPKARTITFTEKFVAKRTETIISELKVGVNSLVALTALNNDKNVILISAEGIDNSSTFPKLYEKVAQKGLIISEYPFDTPKTKESCIFTHRIVGNLCKNLCVMDIMKQSGTNVLVMNAINSGKEIFVKPEVDSQDNYANELINEGANCLTLQTVI